MAIINTGLLTKGLRSEFFQRFADVPAFYQDLSTRIPSTSDHETYRWLGTVPRLREWGTGRVAKGLRTESYSVENLKYEATLEVDRDEIADDQTGQIRIRVAELAERAATHKDYLIGRLLVLGTASEAAAYDGAPFFSSLHVSGQSGPQVTPMTRTLSPAKGMVSVAPGTSSRRSMARATSTSGEMMTSIGRWSRLNRSRQTGSR